MTNDQQYIIRDGRYYSAVNVGGTTWIVKRLEKAPSYEPTDPYVEQELSSNSADQEAVIDQAIAAGSWA